MPNDSDHIRTRIHKASKQIRELEAKIAPLRAIIKHYQSQCSHPGQQTGYNERDGSWANACPVCGDSR